MGIVDLFNSKVNERSKILILGVCFSITITNLSVVFVFYMIMTLYRIEPFVYKA